LSLEHINNSLILFFHYSAIYFEVWTAPCRTLPQKCDLHDAKFLVEFQLIRLICHQSLLTQRFPQNARLHEKHDECVPPSCSVIELWPFHAEQVPFEVQVLQADEAELAKGDRATENETIWMNSRNMICGEKKA
jgi:hypothetical protein